MEIEAKFCIPDEQALQDLLETSVLAEFNLGEADVADLHDRYLDTEDRTIRGQGYAYRLRQSGHRYLATLKSLGRSSDGVHRREEYEVELPEPLPPQDWPPGKAQDLMRRLSGDEPLSVMFEVRQSRHSRPLYDGDRAVAELSLDRGRIYGEYEATAVYLELEAELMADGREEDLVRLGAELQGSWGLTPESRSKYDRGLALICADVAENDARPNSLEERPPGERVQVGGGPRSLPGQVQLLDKPGIEPDDPMSEAGRKIFRFHYRRMLYNEPGTRLGEDIEALHDMRVATRRMRAAFRVFGAYFEPKVVSPYLKGLKRTGRTLGAVRDLDVFKVKVQKYLDTLPDSEQGSLDDLLAVLEERREADREKMIAYLDGQRYRRFVEAFGRFVETTGMGSLPVELDGENPRPYRVRHVVPMIVYRRVAAVRAYDEWVRVPDPPLPRLHALRIACKRLRYTLEFFEEALGSDTTAVIKEIVVMQDHLGDLQDAVVASDILRDFLAWGTWGHDVTAEQVSDLEEMVVAPGVDAYVADKQGELKNLLDAFPEAWARLNGPEFSRMVGEAVMVL